MVEETEVNDAGGATLQVGQRAQPAEASNPELENIGDTPMRYMVIITPA